MAIPPMKLRDWINPNKLDYCILSMNPNAIQFLEKNLDKIDKFYLSINPNAIPLLEKYPDIINWEALSQNPNAIHLISKVIKLIKIGNIWNLLYYYLFRKKEYDELQLFVKKYKPWGISWLLLSENKYAIQLLEENYNNIFWYNLSNNPNAIKLLEKNSDKICWAPLSKNPNAIQLLEKNLDKVDWPWLSCNPNAIHILEKNQDKINWYWLSRNPNAIPLLEKNLDKINWEVWHGLSQNPNAIPFLKKHQNRFYWDFASLCRNPTTEAMILLEDLINKDTYVFKKDYDLLNYFALSSNPAIFVYDYMAMREANRELKEELIQRVWHPSRVAKWLDVGVDLEDL